MVFAEQQQLADNTRQLPEKTSRDAAMDLYAVVKKVHQDTSSVAEPDRVT